MITLNPWGSKSYRIGKRTRRGTGTDSTKWNREMLGFENTEWQVKGETKRYKLIEMVVPLNIPSRIVGPSKSIECAGNLIRILALGIKFRVGDLVSRAWGYAKNGDQNTIMPTPSPHPLWVCLWRPRLHEEQLKSCVVLQDQASEKDFRIALGCVMEAILRFLPFPFPDILSSYNQDQDLLAPSIFLSNSVAIRLNSRL